MARTPKDDEPAEPPSAEEASKGERTRRALLSVAIGHFAERGYQKASVTDIAKALKLSPAAVYRYFPDKEALYLAAVDADAEGLIQLTRVALAKVVPGENIADLLLRIGNDLLGSLDRHPLVAMVLAGAEPELLTSFVELPALAELRTSLEELFTLGQETGALARRVAPRTLAVAFESIVVSQLGYLAARRLRLEDDERWPAIVAVLEASVLP